MACRNPWAVFKTHRQLSILQNGQFTLKWSYWICSIVSFVNKQCTDFYKFADDGTAKVSGVTLQYSLSTMQSVLDEIHKWTKKLRMVINCQKNRTEIICFNRRR